MYPGEESTLSVPFWPLGLWKNYSVDIICNQHCVTTYTDKCTDEFETADSILSLWHVSYFFKHVMKKESLTLPHFAIFGEAS